MKRIIGLLIAGMLLFNMSVLAEDGEQVMLISAQIKTVEADYQTVNGVTMVPLRTVAEELGYAVTWKADTKSVELQKAAQWTSITIGKNAYFRNRMAAHELSSAPTIVDNRTWVPVEFLAEVLSMGMVVENGKIQLMEGAAIIHSGFIKSITTDETGMKTLTLTSDITSDNIELQVIIHTSKDTTFYQKEVKEGDFVQVIGSQMMTMSLPGQTSGYVVY